MGRIWLAQGSFDAYVALDHRNPLCDQPDRPDRLHREVDKSSEIAARGWKHFRTGEMAGVGNGRALCDCVAWVCRRHPVRAQLRADASSLFLSDDRAHCGAADGWVE